MKLSDFDFDLPEHLIALRPVRPRPASRLLVAGGDETHDCHVRDLADWLRPGDMMVFNDTRVIAAQLTGERRRVSADGPGVAKIEVTLIHRATGAARWTALARPVKRLTPGDRIHFGGGLSAEVAARSATAGEIALAFDRSGADLDAAIAGAGVMPLPPLHCPDAAPRTPRTRKTTKRFSRGVPAPWRRPPPPCISTRRCCQSLVARGILVGPPHAACGRGHLPADQGREHRRAPDTRGVGRDHGRRPLKRSMRHAPRADGSSPSAPPRCACWKALPRRTGRSLRSPARPDIFITPGYRFRAIDGLMTNFHLPRSTLFMLVSALMGRARMQALYGHAVEHGYRFYSYGDSSLLLPESIAPCSEKN